MKEFYQKIKFASSFFGRFNLIFNIVFVVKLNKSCSLSRLMIQKIFCEMGIFSDFMLSKNVYSG